MSPADVKPVQNHQLFWDSNLQAVLCVHCDWRYLVPFSAEGEQKPLPVCPNCFQSRLEALDEDSLETLGRSSPELVIPFSLDGQRLEEAVRQFAKGIPFAPDDLNFNLIRSRLLPVFLPMWLVDGQVEALWKAEAGFNYEVVSHQEYFNDQVNSWQSREVREPRVRWEARLGRLKREYQNVGAPALEQSAPQQQEIDRMKLDNAKPYFSGCLGRALVRLPDRSTADAWKDAEAGFMQRASAECSQACASDHMREFQWNTQFSKLNWSLLLAPLYMTWYLDDERKPQLVMINGQTGQVSGKRYASMDRARRLSLTLLVIGLVLAALAMVLGILSTVLPLLIPLAVIALIPGIGLLIAAFFPIAIAWNFNRTDTSKTD